MNNWKKIFTGTTLGLAMAASASPALAYGDTHRAVYGRHHHGPGARPVRGGGAHAAPELAAVGAGGAAVVVIGGLMLLAGRRSKRQQ